MFSNAIYIYDMFVSRLPDSGTVLRLGNRTVDRVGDRLGLELLLADSFF